MLSGQDNAVFSKLLFSALVLLAGTMAYYHALIGPFLLDDVTSVLPARINDLSIKELWAVSFGDVSGPLGRPISVLTFALNNFIAGDSPYSYKLVNLAIHGLNFLLVYWFVTLLFRSAKTLQNGFSDREVALLSFTCSAIWALHPMQVSTVMYVVQRMAMLSATFSLFALIVYLKYRSSDMSIKNRVLWFCAINALIVLSCFSKENGALTYLYIALLEFLLIPGSFAWVRSVLLRNKLASVVAVFALSMAALYIYPSTMSGYVMRDYGAFERTLTQPGVIIFYIKNIIAPNINELSLYHDGYPVKPGIDIGFVVAVFTLLSLCLLMYVSRRRLPIVSVGIGLFFVSHVLESTILPLELIFEHRNYLAILGVLLATFTGIWYFLKKVTEKYSLLVGLSVFSVMLCLPQTYLRSIEWGSEKNMLTVALESKPDSVRAKIGMATLLSVEGRVEDLLIYLDTVSRQHPDVAWFNIQQVMFSGAMGRADPDILDTAIEKLATYSVTTIDVIALKRLYAVIANEQIQWPTLEQLERIYSAANNNDRKQIKINSKAILFGFHSDLLLSLGRFDEAKAAILKSVALQPGVYESSSRLIQIYMLENNHDKALEELQVLKSTVHDGSKQMRARILELEGRVLAEIDVN